MYNHGVRLLGTDGSHWILTLISIVAFPEGLFGIPGPGTLAGRGATLGGRLLAAAGAGPRAGSWGVSFKKSSLKAGSAQNHFLRRCINAKAITLLAGLTGSENLTGGLHHLWDTISVSTSQFQGCTCASSISSTAMRVCMT